LKRKKKREMGQMVSMRGKKELIRRLKESKYGGLIFCKASFLMVL
jgi:hypothetical protein